MAHPGGRPLKFETPQEIEDAAEEYFDLTSKDEWTITGLALALDTSRETLMNYEERPEFFDTIKKLKTKIENQYEISLRRNGRSGDIFALKNFGWKDQTQQDVNLSGGITWHEEKTYVAPGGQPMETKGPDPYAGMILTKGGWVPK